MSKFAFSTKRISEHNIQHIQALKEAITSGVKLIDTSDEYLGGSSLRAVAIAFRELDDEITKDVKIVSKFSYKEDGDVAKNLSATLNQLELENIECFMFHNLEYYLLDAINKDIPKDDRLDGMNKIVYKVFLELENEIKNSKFNSYGICSENFSIEHSSDLFLPYEDLISIAKMAAKDAGNEKHSFSTIELPVNIVERDGLKCAKWAKDNSLTVVSSRALNTIYQTKQYRLAEYKEGSEYFYYLNELLDVCDNDMLKPLYNLVDELDASKHKFEHIESYDNFLFQNIIPHVKNVITQLDEENAQTLVTLLDMFLDNYKKTVEYECGVKTKKELKEFFKECNFSMQECSLNFLLQQKNIDYIAVGMRKPSYVAEVLSLQD
jgi:aryl-alcohol dehydrogenase-like predicted oxidoreductase